MAKRLSKITRRDIIDSIREGFDVGGRHMTFDLFGRFDEEGFLSELYDLDKMESCDPRFSSALYELRCHRQSFDDYPDFWFFDDERFLLGYNDDDEPLLKMVCKALHPEVRLEQGCWQSFLEHLNKLLKPDGYVIACSSYVSGREVFSFSDIDEVSDSLPTDMYFRERNAAKGAPFGTMLEQAKGDIGADAKRKVAEILLDFKQPVVRPLNRYSEMTRTTDAFALAWDKLEEYLGEELMHITVGFAFDEPGYTQQDFLEELPSDVILTLAELQFFELSATEKLDFRRRLNTALRSGRGCLAMSESGLIVKDVDLDLMRTVVNDVIENVREKGLGDLVAEAAKLYGRNTLESKRLAVEKIWDAFERLKTAYSDLDKKRSAELVIINASLGNEDFKDLLDKEFKELTRIGNEFRIRHHETGKHDINAEAHYDYLFTRCLIAMRLVMPHLGIHASSDN